MPGIITYDHTCQIMGCPLGWTELVMVFEPGRWISVCPVHYDAMMVATAYAIELSLSREIDAQVDVEELVSRMVEPITD